MAATEEGDFGAVGGERRDETEQGLGHAKPLSDPFKPRDEQDARAETQRRAKCKDHRLQWRLLRMMFL